MGMAQKEAGVRSKKIIKRIILFQHLEFPALYLKDIAVLQHPVYYNLSVVAAGIFYDIINRSAIAVIKLLNQEINLFGSIVLVLWIIFISDRFFYGHRSFTKLQLSDINPASSFQFFQNFRHNIPFAIELPYLANHQNNVA